MFRLQQLILMGCVPPQRKQNSIPRSNVIIAGKLSSLQRIYSGDSKSSTYSQQISIPKGTKIHRNSFNASKEYPPSDMLQMNLNKIIYPRNVMNKAYVSRKISSPNKKQAKVDSCKDPKNIFPIKKVGPDHDMISKIASVRELDIFSKIQNDHEKKASRYFGGRKIQQAQPEDSPRERSRPKQEGIGMGRQWNNKQ